MNELTPHFSRFITKELKNRKMYAVAGHPDGTLFAENADGSKDTNFIWVQIAGSSDDEATTSVRLARCRKATPRYNSNIIVEFSLADGELEVVEEDPILAIQSFGKRGINVPPHASNHTLYEPDTIYISGFQFTPLLAHPNSPPDLNVYVEKYSYNYSGTEKVWLGGLLDLTAALPTNITEQVAVVIYLDPATNTLGYTAGTPVETILTDFRTQVFTASDLTAISTTGKVRIAGVRLYYGQTKIVLFDFIEDLRQFAGTLTAGSLLPDPVTIAHGGVGFTTYTTGDLIYASATNTLAKRAIGSTGQFLNVTGGVPTWHTLVAGDIPQLAHSSLSGLTTGDDHTQYVMLAGRSGGQTAYGGTAAFDDLAVNSTFHTDKGNVTIAGSLATFDELNQVVAIGTTPVTTVQLQTRWDQTDPPAFFIGVNVRTTALYTSNSTIGTEALGATAEFDIATGVTMSQTGFGFVGQIRPSATNLGTMNVGTAFAGRLQVLTGSGGRFNNVNVMTSILQVVGANTFSVTTLKMFVIQPMPALNGMTINTLMGLDIPDMSVGTTANFAIRTSAGNIVFNNGNDTNTDLNWKGVGDNSAFYCKSSTASIGIGTNAPTAFLHIKASTTSRASLNLTAGTAPTSPNAGDMWEDSTQKAFQVFADGIKQTLEGVIFTQTADKTVNNTVTETTLFTTGVGTITLPANFFVIGKSIRIRAKGYYSTTGNPNITFKVKYGSTVLLDSGAFAVGAAVTNHLWFVDAIITCRTTGSSGTVFTQGMGKLFTAPTTVTEFDLETTATTTINTTTSNALDLTVTWGTADAADTITATNITVEVLN